MNLLRAGAKNLKLICFLVALLLAQTSLHAQLATFPSHCLPGETVFLSAKMKRVIRSPQEVIYKDTEKVLSLCADKSAHPISKLSYRYGPIGAIELERVATKSKPFGYAELALGNKVSIDAYFFDVNEFTYYVTVAGAMGSGISLEVYRGERQVVDLFSGNDDTTDFYMPFAVRADAVLTVQTPKHLSSYK
jgi:hypothetical protein